MPKNILQAFVAELEGAVEDLQQRLNTQFDFTEVERLLGERVDGLRSSLLAMMLDRFHGASGLLDRLKTLGGRLGMRFKEVRGVRIRLGAGELVEVQAPYFLKARAKRGRKKRGPNGRGVYLSLEVLGFVDRCSAGLISEVVQMGLLCPSLEVAREVLNRGGMVLDIKTIRRLCARLGERGLSARGEISLSGTENMTGQTLVIGIDGGRLRERRRKRGRKKAGQRRQGYHTDWKEPKLFTLYVLDEQGQIVKTFHPLHDATMGDHEAMFAVLRRYLKALDLSGVAKVVFCGDGAPWIWSGVEALCAQLGLAPERTYQVLDHTHAKQNLQEIIDLLPKRITSKQTLEKQWKTLLWQGDLKGLYQAIMTTITGKKARGKAQKKWQNYFASNRHRLQYQRFEQAHIPCGSGCVESAIRRVINLRLKAPGSFWTKPMAECFLFLRSQLLSGRWDIFIANVTRKTAKLFESQQHNGCPQQPCEILLAA